MNVTIGDEGVSVHIKPKHTGHTLCGYAIGPFTHPFKETKTDRKVTCQNCIDSLNELIAEYVPD